MDAPVAPRGVLARQTQNRLACCGDGRRATRTVRVGPVLGDETSMPTQERLRPNKEHRPAVTAEGTRANALSKARSSGVNAWARDLALQDGELVAQHEDLDILRPIAPAAQDEQVDHEADKSVETGHADEPCSAQITTTE